jgi:hypothetical protein
MKVFVYILTTAALTHVALGFDFFDWGRSVLKDLQNLLSLPPVFLDKDWIQFKIHFQKSFSMTEELNK